MERPLSSEQIKAQTIQDLIYQICQYFPADNGVRQQAQTALETLLKQSIKEKPASPVSAADADFIHEKIVQLSNLMPEQRGRLIDFFQKHTHTASKMPTQAQVNLLAKIRQNLVTPADDDDEQFEPAMLSLNGQELMFSRSLIGIIGQIGTGKSHIAEVIAARYLTGGIIENGLQCQPAERDVLYIDLERGRRHVKTRASLRVRHHLIQGDLYKRFRMIDGVTFAPEEILETLRLCMQEFPTTGLIIIDPLTSAVRNPNELEECFDLLRSLRQFYAANNVAVIATIHGNRNDVSNKGKGHLGDALQREATSFLLVDVDAEDSDTRILTANFSNGKLREGCRALATTAFKWNECKQCYDEQETSPAHANKNIKAEFLRCFQMAQAKGMPVSDIPQGDLMSLYKDCHNIKSEKTIRPRITSAVLAGLLTENRLNQRKVLYSFISDSLLSEN